MKELTVILLGVTQNKWKKFNEKNTQMTNKINIDILKMDRR